MSNDFVLETNNLKKIYGKEIVVNDVNIHLKKGRIYGLLGRNGAGKTTIMKMILGLVSQTSGEINLFGSNLSGNEKLIYPRIGSIIETPGFYSNLTGTENLEIFARLRGTISKDAIEKSLEFVGLPYDDKKVFSSYSLGMKQRLGIANALLNDPELLILDEPTNGLDPIGIAEIREFIKKLSTEQGKTIIISSHILSEIALMADDIGIIHQGNLLEETTLENLKIKNQKYLALQVSSVPNTINILECKLNINNYSVEPDNFVRIYNNHYEPSLINEILVQSGIKVSNLQVCCDNLEDYFKKLTGGAGIA